MLIQHESLALGAEASRSYGMHWGRGVKYMSNYTLIILGLLYFTSGILKLNTLAQFPVAKMMFHFSEINLDL